MKKKVIKIVSLVMLQALYFVCVSQSYKSDSLEQAIKNMNEDSTKLKALYNLSQDYLYKQPDKSVFYSVLTSKLASEIKNNKYFIKALICRGNAYNVLGNYDSAEANLLKAVALCESKSNKNDPSMAFIGLGSIERKQGNYKAATIYFMKAIKASEETGNAKAKGNAIMNLANVSLQSNQSEIAFKYYFEALKIFEDLKDETAKLQCMGNIGGLYYMKKEYKKAIEYYTAIAALFEKKENIEGLSNTMNNLGNVYAAQEDYNTALKYYEKALDLFGKVDNRQGIILATNNIGGIHYEQKHYELALKYLFKGMEAAKQINSRDDIKISYETLSSVYVAMKNYKEAYEYQKHYADIKDSLLNTENLKQINDMQAKYETEKKDKELTKKDAEIFKHQAETKQKSIQRNGFIIGFGLMLLLTFFILKGYRLKRNANIELAKKNELIEMQKIIVEEKQKEIIDSIYYAKRIQTALITSEKYIDRNLNKLQKNS